MGLVDVRARGRDGGRTDQQAGGREGGGRASGRARGQVGGWAGGLEFGKAGVRSIVFHYQLSASLRKQTSVEFDILPCQGR